MRYSYKRGGTKCTTQKYGGYMVNTIASERTRMGLSQAQLAEMIGKGRATIAKWEADPFSISGTNLCRLSNIFGCSIDYLLGISDERMPNREV